MRHLLALALALATVACGKDKLSPPDPTRYQAMRAEERCQAVAPRATPCIDELLVADMTDVMGSAGREAAQQLDDEVHKRRASGEEAAAMHRLQCAGSPRYPDAVVACWTTETCKAFADCVIRVEHAAPAR